MSAKSEESPPVATAGASLTRSGPEVAKLFQILLALTFLVAWLSLGNQIDVLIGHRGLDPVASLLPRLHEHNIGFSRFPSLLLYGASDDAIHGLIAWGVGVSALSLFGIFPRLLFAINTALYLSITVACQGFLTFQWDNLLLECGMLAVFLSRNSEQRWSHFLFRALLFKLYFESGIAKYQSPIGDWQDGSAMSFYYETAPIPTALAWFMHHMPATWHKLESWLTLLWEIGVPFLIFGSRRIRLLALCVFSAFQIINILTANYGFFSYLALAMGVFLLAENDAQRLHRAIRRNLIRVRAQLRARFSAKQVLFSRPLALLRLAARRVRHATHRMQALHGALPAALFRSLSSAPSVALRYAAIGCFTTAYLALSLDGALQTFWRDAAPQDDFFDSVRDAYEPFRLVNTYHLFAAITRDRIEPEFQVYTGNDFQPLSMHYKPGPLDRAPPFVAPYQPRVDFLLWFYGLSFQRGTPGYVVNLLHRLCDDPQAVQPLFVEPLPAHPQAVRIAFNAYHFTTSDERAQTGNWWKREEAGQPITMGCQGR
ncbi:MAG TPA: lipase maturation factor family protein [Polyangiaceae bacterium]|nr:lipase maturation factor family protein [Polyangiaceae bacterium]